MHNNERIIRRTKHALSWLDFDLNRSSGATQPRCTVKRAQRILKRIQGAALREQSVRKRARRTQQQDAAGKWLHGCSQGIGPDMPVTPDEADNTDNWPLDLDPVTLTFTLSVGS